MIDFSNLFTKVETHGFTVMKHLNWDFMNWIAITPVGSVVIFRDRTDHMLYATFSRVTGRYHIHIPYNNDIMTIDERAVKVLEEVRQCLSLGLCYLEDGIVFSINKFRIRDFIPFGMGEHTSNIKTSNIKK